MALPISIADLLNKRKVESNRIEFKAGWNPDKIYHTICAFANDLDNLGGGYILVGVEEENGVAKRPVKGIPEPELDKIQKDMIGFNNKIEPYYMPRTEIEEIDGQYIMAIWVPTGAYRPYCVTENVVSKHSVPKWYVRSGSSSIEAKGEILDELRDTASRIPFDERGNANIELNDISKVLVYDYLLRVKSHLADNFSSYNIKDVLEQMDLYVGPSENRMLKNVAAMMFCEHPEKFFRYTQVDIVSFPEGKINNPNNFTEITIKGSVPQIIAQSIDYLHMKLGQKHIIKRQFSAESFVYFDYPLQAIEEALVNSLYHRSYEIPEPVEITIEPDRVSFLNFPGPDRSISADTIEEGENLRSRKYRNRRLGDFLKELELTEGRSTGIPTIQSELRKNGSPRAKFETNDERTYFIIDIPCHAVVTREQLLEEESRTVDEQLYHIDIKMFKSYVDTLASSPRTVGEQLIEKMADATFKENVERLLSFLSKGSYSKNQLIVLMKDIKRTTLHVRMIQPLLALNMIALSEPEKPNSKNQKYTITSVGAKMITLNNAVIN